MSLIQADKSQLEIYQIALKRELLAEVHTLFIVCTSKFESASAY